ncbi:MAG TPA: gamma-glutamylcyclotransferase family protein [Edaphobacter sp.]
MPTPQHLFVYGTLHPDRAPAEMQHAVAHLTYFAKATITGELHNLGDYPGLSLHREQNTIPGTVFTLPDDPALLAALDDYEGYLPHDPAASLFLRVIHPVTLEDGTRLDCWVYLYNQPTP